MVANQVLPLWFQTNTTNAALNTKPRSKHALFAYLWHDAGWFAAGGRHRMTVFAHAHWRFVVAQVRNFQFFITTSITEDLYEASGRQGYQWGYKVIWTILWHNDDNDDDVWRMKTQLNICMKWKEEISKKLLLNFSTKTKKLTSCTFEYCYHLATADEMKLHEARLLCWSSTKSKKKIKKSKFEIKQNLKKTNPMVAFAVVHWKTKTEEPK